MTDRKKRPCAENAENAAQQSRVFHVADPLKSVIIIIIIYQLRIFMPPDGKVKPPHQTAGSLSGSPAAQTDVHTFSSSALL